VAKKVTSIVSPIKTIYLKKNSSYKAVIKAYNGNTASDALLTYTSSVPKTLTVDKNGKLKARSVKKKTKVKVTVAAGNGYRKAITVYVVPKAKKLKSVKLAGAPSKLKVGRYKQLSVKLGTAAATNLTPKFSSSKKSVITVDSSGKIIAKKKGRARITVRVGGRKAVTKFIKVA
jgi:uncharacterized protein YjdB